MDEYPEIKLFLTKRNGIKSYPEISIRWINGKNPDLIINENERIDLTLYKSREEIHTLLQSKGFTNISPNFQFPRDKNENCKKWANEGQCISNHVYMNEYCSYSCNKSEL